MQLKTLASALVGLLLAASLSAGMKDGCPRCKYRGMVECKSHTEEIHAFEKEVLFCAVVADCKRCGGTLLTDCKGCSGGPAEAIAAARRIEIEAWMKLDEVETHFGRALPRIETVNYQLVINTGPLKEGRKRIKEHVLAHRVAHDVEAATKSMNADFALLPADYDSKMRMWIWSNPEDHKMAMSQFLGTGSDGDFKMLGNTPVFSVWTEPGLFNTVEDVRTLFTHNATHMLLSNAMLPLWIGDLGGGWLDAAVGHHYEYEIFERTANYCIEEATLAANYANGVWRTAVRRYLGKNDERVLPRLFRMNTGAMTQKEQAQCWSFFEYLLHNHKPKLRAILTDLKAKMKPRKVLPAHIGLDTFAAETAWRTWVKASYPKRGDKLRRAK